MHITAASEGEYSWCSPRYGGWFTRAMVDAFDDTSDTNVDGFVSWEEVFAITKDTVQKKFRQTYGFFSADQKKDMSNRGINSQTPKYYSMVKKSSSTNIQMVSQDTTKITESNQETTKVPDSLKTINNLWTLSNPSSSFAITIESDKPSYNIGENVTFRIKTTENCYIIVINWNSQDEPIQLYPNKYESGNFAVKGKEYMLPSSNPKYDFRVSGSKGEERIKLIALINRNDNQTLRSLIPLDDGSGSTFSRLAVVPRKDLSGNELEAKIVGAIKMLKSSDWATANCIIQVK
ncbi:TPA: DUF4384 domain-containing protein [bacterium]|nr:DUF4384 domain-containing protein [bacterium]